MLQALCAGLTLEFGAAPAFVFIIFLFCVFNEGTYIKTACYWWRLKAKSVMNCRFISQIALA